MLEMPFLGEDVSFFVLLPEGNGGLDETISRLSLTSLQEAMSRTFPLSLEIGIPKFRMEQSINLQRVSTYYRYPSWQKSTLNIKLVHFYYRH